MVYLTLKGGTELKAFNTKEERQQWCENNNILMFSRKTPVFKKHEHKIKENFPFMFEQSSIQNLKPNVYQLLRNGDNQVALLEKKPKDKKRKNIEYIKCHYRSADYAF